ncbi:hypothetical protein F5Y10DRAFT_294503 [Nemania abortiva]|nr:hypothetical protein F5Y10DRAFT_294503 [Nemania abortiva]
MAEQVIINGNVISQEDLRTTSDAKFTKYLLLKGKGPINTERKRELAVLGVAILEYLGQDSYLCRYDPDDLEPIRGLPFVEYASIYSRRMKTSARLQEALQASQQPSNFHIEIALHEGDHNADNVLDRLSGLGILRDDVSVNHDKLQLKVPDDVLREIAKIDDVRSIDHVHDDDFF